MMEGHEASLGKARKTGNTRGVIITGAQTLGSGALGGTAHGHGAKSLLAQHLEVGPWAKRGTCGVPRAWKVKHLHPTPTPSSNSMSLAFLD